MNILLIWQRGIKISGKIEVANQVILRWGDYLRLSRWAQRIIRMRKKGNTWRDETMRWTQQDLVDFEDGGTWPPLRHVDNL